MKIVDFPEKNLTYAENQPEYLPLPAYRWNESPAKEVVSCWQLSVWERIKLLFTGRVWFMLSTFGEALQPQYTTINKKEVLPQPAKEAVKNENS